MIQLNYCYYYVSTKKYIVSQLARNGIHDNYFNISGYKNVCKSAEYIAGLLEEKELLCRKCSDAINAHMTGQKLSFVFLTLRNIKYGLLSSEAIVEAVSEYNYYDRVFSFIAIISGKFIEEYYDEIVQENFRRKKYFGRLLVHPESFHVIGKLSWDGDKAYIQPLIIY